MSDGAAAGGQYMSRSLQESFDDLGFPISKALFPMQLEKVGNRHARGLLDLGVGVKKRQSQPRCESAPHRGFAGPHHSNQNDGAGAVKFRVFARWAHGG